MVNTVLEYMWSQTKTDLTFSESNLKQKFILAAHPTSKIIAQVFPVVGEYIYPNG